MRCNYKDSFFKPYFFLLDYDNNFLLLDPWSSETLSCQSIDQASGTYELTAKVRQKWKV